MAKRTVIDHKTGFTNEFITEGGKDIFHTTQDISPVIEHCKNIAENVKPGKDLRHVAEVHWLYIKELVEKDGRMI